MRRLFFVLLLGAAAPACKDAGTTFTFDSGGAAVDAPKTATDGGASDGASADVHTTPDVAQDVGADVAPIDGGDAGTITDDGSAG